MIGAENRGLNRDRAVPADAPNDGQTGRAFHWLAIIKLMNFLDKSVRHKRLRPALTAAALLCIPQAESVQDLAAEQRDAYLSECKEYCRIIVPDSGRIIVCLAKRSDKLALA
jgi:hypothetical protein